MRPWMLADINLHFARQHPYEVAVLPIGAIEPHNLHLPYGCDALHAAALAERCCRYAYERGGRVLCLPAIPYGTDSNLLEFPLTINVYPSTLGRFVHDIVDSLEKHGILKFVIFNSHGGNEFKWLLRELVPRTRVFCTLVEWWRVIGDVEQEVCEGDPGEHGGEMETSLALALFGDLVFLDQADAGAVRPSRLEGLRSGLATITRPWHRLTTHSGVGDPSKATRQKGERIVAAVTQRVGDFLLELATQPLDEQFPY